MKPKQVLLMVLASGILSGLVARLPISPAVAADAPQSMAYQARLTDRDGKPVTGTYEVVMGLFSTASGGDAICSDGFRDVNVLDGNLKIVLGTGNAVGKTPRCSAALAEAFRSHQEVYVEVSVGGETLEPRALVDSVGHAFHAQNAEHSTISEHAVDGVPPGTIVASGGAAVPSGWLLCDGAARRSTDDPALFASIQKAWGDGSTGTGSGTGTDFNVPDLRGIFLRGLDVAGKTDPDGTVRTIGDRQLSDVGSHRHHLTDPGHSHTVPGYQNAQGPNWGFNDLYNHVTNYVGAGSVGASTIGFENTDNFGGKETRPINVAVNYLIKR